MKKIIYSILLFQIVALAQEKVKTQNNSIQTEITINPLIKGTLYETKDQMFKTNLIIIIAGSGPTDRNGNQAQVKNNSIKFLAEGIVGIKNDVFSYDKRIIAQMATGKINEKELSFENFINDAKDVINHFKSQKKYKKIIVAGHSEGSLIGMIAAHNNADGFISLAGVGRTIDLVLEEQILKQMPALKDELHEDFAKLKKGETFETKNPILASIFRPSVQPYMISWIKYNPTDEIKKLKIPALIINGTKDLQVQVMDANLLKEAKPDAKLEIIDNMNHIFKTIKGDQSENMDSYNNPDLPISPTLITVIENYLKSIH